jgi:putative glutamine amidotransferase
VHGQGIDQIAPTLKVEALAPDGQIEAVTITSHPGFSLAVQWHPEWKPTESEASIQIFAAFGDACRTHVASKEIRNDVVAKSALAALAA